MLHLNAGDDNVDEVQRLLDEKAEIDFASPAGLTALHVAAGEGAERVVDLLCKAKANVNAVTRFGKETAAHRAACEGQHGCVSRLAAASADLDALSNEGFSALHEACREGNTETVKILLELGASANVISNTGLSPLHLAVRYENLDSVKLLVASNANIYSEDRDGESPSELVNTVADAGRAEALLKALGGWKPRLLLEYVVDFIPRLQARIGKETGMTLDDADKTVAHPRFRRLFTMAEFKSFVSLRRLKDGRLEGVTDGDLDDDTWQAKAFGMWCNTRRIFGSSLEAPRPAGRRQPTAEELSRLDQAHLARQFVPRALGAAAAAAAASQAAGGEDAGAGK